MKKFWISAAVLALSLMLGATAFASNATSTRVNCRNSIDTRCSFVDANGDEVCDNRSTHCISQGVTQSGGCMNATSNCASAVDTSDGGLYDTRHAPKTYNGGDNGSYDDVYTQNGGHHGSRARCHY